MVTVEGKHTSPADRERLYSALTDPGTFERAIDACERVETDPDGNFRAHVMVDALGSRRRQDVQVVFEEKHPPEQLLLRLSATTPAGGVQSSLRVRLGADDGGTGISYRVETTLSGILGSLGPRLVEMTVRRVMGEFFSKLDNQLAVGT
jgi:carbon monoxide dehydrogenase subunit G